jgi:hypothetical protein
MIGYGPSGGKSRGATGCGQKHLLGGILRFRRLLEKLYLVDVWL